MAGAEAEDGDTEMKATSRAVLARGATHASACSCLMNGGREGETERKKKKSQLLSSLVRSYGKTLSFCVLCARVLVPRFVYVALALGANNLLEGTAQLLSASASSSSSSFVYAHFLSHTHTHKHTETHIHGLVKPFWVVSHEASCTLLGLTIPYLCYTSG